MCRVRCSELLREGGPVEALLDARECRDALLLLRESKISGVSGAVSELLDDMRRVIGSPAQRETSGARRQLGRP